MIARYADLGPNVLEVVVEGEIRSLDINVLPAPIVPAEPPPASEPDTVGPESALVAAPLAEAVSCAAEPPPTKKKRTLMGVIRAGWFYVFTAIGEFANYLLENKTGLGLPRGVAGTIIGGALYGTKRAIWPNTTI